MSALQDQEQGPGEYTSLESLHSSLQVGQPQFEKGEQLVEQDWHVQQWQELKCWDEVQRREKAYGAFHDDTLRMKLGLVEQFRRQHKYSEAEQFQRQHIKQLDEALGATHMETIRVKSDLEGTLELQQKWSEAEQQIRHVLQELEEAKGAQDHLATDRKCRLAFAIYKQQKYPQAEQLLRELIQQLEETSNGNEWRRRDSIHLLSLILREHGNYAEAEQLLRQATEIHKHIIFGREDRRYFVHSRERPDLPPGYQWETQIAKYSPTHFTRVLENMGSEAVFCHRGLYDRAMMLMENSTSSIMNGAYQGLLLHEVDVRMDPKTSKLFLAHDEVASRVTSEARNWNSLSISRIDLVAKRFDVRKQDFTASSYFHIHEKVPFVEDLLADNDIPRLHELCLQLDLRGKDFLHAISYFSKQTKHDSRILLKGYNLDFTSGLNLKRALTAENFGQQWSWTDLLSDLSIMMVFYSQPLVSQALQDKGINPKSASLGDRLGLEFEEIYNAVINQVLSFIEIFDIDQGEMQRCSFIPEIVHTGLGLGYDVSTKRVRNPLNGEPIKDLEVTFESRVDRAMIEVSLELKKRYPILYSSSCTRLYEVRTSEGEELVAGIKTGALRLKPDGERGISTKIRSMHGGMYPQSDIVVADDPYAEIAARTWIDEYAGLDRKKLLELSYDDWLMQRPDVAEAVKKLNGPFLPNTVESYSRKRS